jgi:hypothetical protein
VDEFGRDLSMRRAPPALVSVAGGLAIPLKGAPSGKRPRTDGEGGGGDGEGVTVEG